MILKFRIESDANSLVGYRGAFLVKSPPCFSPNWPESDIDMTFEGDGAGLFDLFPILLLAMLQICDKHLRQYALFTTV